MKTRVFFFLAAAALLAGCAKEIQAPLELQNGEPFVLQVGINNPESEPANAPSKTYLGGSNEGKRKVYWSNGDKIAVNGVASEELSGLADNTSSTSFTFGSSPSTPYNIVYPASIYTDATHVTLPAVQTYRADGIDDNMFPMAGTSADGSSTTLHHLCAIVKIAVTRETAAEAEARSGSVDTDNIACVRFKGRNSEKVSGSFAIDYSTPALTAANGTGADLEVRVVKNQATSTSTALIYYLVVPARTYSNGFDIIVQDVNGDIMTKSKTASTPLVAGKLYNMTEFDFVPNGTEQGIVIDSADDLIAFATAFNNKDYDGLGSSLIATLTSDITFDAPSSALFNATYGIGQKKNVHGVAEDNYFGGVFNGNNKVISGLQATVPLFAYTDSESSIKDLTLDSTCSLSIEESDTDTVHGMLIGRNKGLVKNCTSNADVVIDNIQNVTTASQHYGGLVGRNYGGTIDGCIVSGNITCSQTGQTVTANEAYIGGIAGSMGNSGSVNNSSFTGNILISDATTYGGITAESRNFDIGGIVGYSEGGVISGCTAGIDGTPRSIDVRGIFVPAVGGILAWSTTSTSSETKNSNNYMSLSVASNGARAKTTPCRVGGIVGHSAAPISGCINSGAISSTTNSTTLYLGGIVSDGVNVSNCTNNAGGTVTRSNADQTGDQANRYMYLGGIMGTALASGDITTCTNHAAITSNVPGTATATTLDMGGIVGANGSSTNFYQIDITGCVNDGEVKLNNDNASAVAATRNNVGGIIGYNNAAESTVSGCTNSGKVWCNNNTAGSYGPIAIGGMIGRSSAALTVTDCVNTGAILCQKVGASTKTTVDVGGIVGWAEGQIVVSGTNSGDTRNSGAVDVAEDNATTTVYARITMGGILGYASAANSTITNSNNSAQVHCEFQGSGNNRCSYIGGIAGIMALLTYNADGTPKGFGGNAGIEIASCNNTGTVWSRNLNTAGGNKTACFTGGIVGALAGTDADHKASLHDCTSATGQTINYRGIAGGIAGYLSYASLSDNSASQTITGNQKNTRGSGGIVGSAVNSSTLSNCTFSGAINSAYNIGGLAYVFNGASITGCKVNGATITKGTNASATAAAVLVSSIASGVTVTNCGVKGTLDGAAITLSSNMITTDGGATVTGTYLLP